MDAVKFIQEFDRMNGGIFKSQFNGMSVEKAVKVVEEWSAAHPRKTQQDLFLERYPNAPLWNDGMPSVDPCDINENAFQNPDCTENKNCYICRKNFWEKEVK